MVNGLARPKIWMIIPTFHPVIGGAQSQVQRLSQVLNRDGWTVRVLTRQHSETFRHGLPAEDLVDGVPVSRLYSRGSNKADSFLFVVCGLWYLLRHGRRNIYHAHDISAAGWLALVARYLLGGRCLIKLRTGCYGYKKHLSSRFTRWQFITQVRLADRIVVVNSELERMLQSLGTSTTRVIRIPNSVDTSQFHPPSIQQKTSARQRLGFPNDKTIVLYVGRLAQYKGVDTLLRAWALLPINVRQHSQLVIVGDGPEQGRLHDLIVSLGIRESVSAFGMQLAVSDFYWASDIFVLPSETEGLSNTLIEAMACGLPVVASGVGGALDLVEQGQNGLLFESGNFAQLAERMISLLNARSQWGDMGLQARQSVMMHADLPATATKFRELYYQLIREMRT